MHISFWEETTSDSDDLPRHYWSQDLSIITAAIKSIIFIVITNFWIIWLAGDHDYFGYTIILWKYIRTRNSINSTNWDLGSQLNWDVSHSECLDLISKVSSRGDEEILVTEIDNRINQFITQSRVNVDLVYPWSEVVDLCIRRHQINFLVPVARPTLSWWFYVLFLFQIPNLAILKMP